MTLNDPVYVEAAQALGRRIAKKAADAATSVALRLPPVPGEAAGGDGDRSGWCSLYRDDRAEVRRRSPKRPRSWRPSRSAAPPEGADPAEMAAWTVVGNVLLNLDEMFMKR